MSSVYMKGLAAFCCIACTGGCASPKFVSVALSSLAQGVVATVSKALPESRHERNPRDSGAAAAQRLYTDPATAYRQALEREPRNAELRNALGVTLARQGLRDQAVQELLAASAQAPAAAHIHNNLGYTYLLQGRDEEAVAALRIASQLDPASERARQNLTLAERLAAAAHPPMARVAPPAPQAAPALPTAAEPMDPTLPRLVQISANVFELRQGVPAPVASRAPQVLQMAHGLVQLEIANGNGVTGMAKRISSSLLKRGFGTARLTNQLPYTQALTEIHYRQGAEPEAIALRALLSQRVHIIESRSLNPEVTVRLVLGHDAGQPPLLPDSGLHDALAAAGLRDLMPARAAPVHVIATRLPAIPALSQVR